MNKQQQLNYDKKVLASLEAEYKRAQRVIYSIRELVTNLNFEELIPDPQERLLIEDELNVYELVQSNLMKRIRFYRDRVKLEENKEKIAEHLEHEQREFMPIIRKMNRVFMVDMSNIQHDKLEDFQRGEITVEEMLEGISYKEVSLPSQTDEQHHCGQDAVNFEQLSEDMTDAYKDYCRGVFEQFLSREISWAKFVEKVALPFCHENVNEFVNAIKEGRSDCGQDVRVQYDPNESQPINVPVQGDDCDDACCQARAGRVDHDAAPAASQTGESLQQLVGYQVIAVCKPGSKCNGCPYEHYNAPCVKLELVGGVYLCLEPLPNSVVTE